MVTSLFEKKNKKWSLGWLKLPCAYGYLWKLSTFHSKEEEVIQKLHCSPYELKKATRNENLLRFINGHKNLRRSIDGYSNPMAPNLSQQWFGRKIFGKSSCLNSKNDMFRRLRPKLKKKWF